MNNSYYCSLILDIQTNRDCYFHSLIKLNLKEYNETYCELIDNEFKDICISKRDSIIYEKSLNLIGFKKDSCNNIARKDLKIICKEMQIFKDKTIIELCDIYNTTKIRNICFYDKGINLYDEKYCKKIENNSKMIKTCIGLSTSNLSICNEINDPVYKQMCLNPIP